MFLCLFVCFFFAITSAHQALSLALPWPSLLFIISLLFFPLTLQCINVCIQAPSGWNSIVQIQSIQTHSVSLSWDVDNRLNTNNYSVEYRLRLFSGSFSRKLVRSGYSLLGVILLHIISVSHLSPMRYCVTTHITWPLLITSHSASSPLHKFPPSLITGYG